MYVTDINHFEGLESIADPPRPAVLLAEHLRRIIAAATAHASPGEHATALPCRKRPGRKPCPGRLVVRRQDLPEEIAWGCPVCAATTGEEGYISGWRGSLYDLSKSAQVHKDEAVISVVVPDDAYRLLIGNTVFDLDCECVIYAARPHEHGAELVMTEADCEELAGFVAFEANHSDNRRLQRRWDEIFELLNRAL